MTTNTVRITASEIDGRTVGEIFAFKGFMKETTKLIDAYDRTVANYFDWRARYGARFSARGVGFYTEDPNSSHRDMDWSRKDVEVLSSSGVTARLVNDESILLSRALILDAPGEVLATYLRKAGKSNKFDAVRELQAALPKGLFRQLPVHAYILMFHLDLHRRGKIRRHDGTLRRTGRGRQDPTAEVYSEIIKRPLYRVHSGQLGLGAGAMESALKGVDACATLGCRDADR